MMRDNRREQNYGDYNHDNNYDNNQHRPYEDQFQRRNQAGLGDTRREQGEYYRMQQNQDFERRAGNYQGTQEDYYKTAYDISNYDGNPRSYDYGMQNGPVDELNDVQHYPLAEGPYSHREHYRYSQGYNANYDNPEEGDRYRDFDSRGNHGFRHDAGYGVTNEFREFEDDRYDRPNESRHSNNNYRNRHSR